MKEKDIKNRIFTIPNILSFFRLCLIPFFIWLYVGKKAYYLTAGVLILSGITDIVDGYIARRYNLISHLGRILDPIADKLTQIAMMVCLAYRYIYLLVPLIALVVKEVVCGIFGLIMIKRTNDTIDSRWYGKVVTVLLYLIMITHLFWVEIIPIVSIMMTGIVTAFIILSFVMYLLVFIGKSIIGKNRDKRVKSCKKN